MLGFKSFEAAQDILAGIEIMRRIKTRNGRWWSRRKKRALMRPNNSTPLAAYHPTDRVTFSHIVYTCPCVTEPIIIYAKCPTR